MASAEQPSHYPTRLQDIAHRTSIGFGTFAVSGSLAVLIALTDVGWQAVRAALANPVESLRYEWARSKGDHEVSSRKIVLASLGYQTFRAATAPRWRAFVMSGVAQIAPRMATFGCSRSPDTCPAEAG